MNMGWWRGEGIEYERKSHRRSQAQKLAQKAPATRTPATYPPGTSMHRSVCAHAGRANELA